MGVAVVVQDVQLMSANSPCYQTIGNSCAYTEFVSWRFCSYVWNKGKDIADDGSSDDVWLEWEAQQLKVSVVHGF